MALSAGLAALLFPSLREAVGIATPDRAAMSASKRLFDAALAGEASSGFQGTGLRARTPPEGWEGVVYSEPEGQCRGRGIYLVRSGSVQPLAITAPHRGADRNTGTLAAQLFLESAAVAAAWNSAPRSPTATCPHAIDLAKAPEHPFTAFALSFARRHPKGRIVQLHGFDRAKRATAATSEAAMIISNGTMTPDPALLDLADCLSVVLDPAPVLVFPYEAKELGALKNAQGQALRAAGFAGFVHLEMAGDLRQRLVDDPALRERFSSCLQGIPG
ncbi:hypothetical protein LY632_02685 [Erythrobacter sp. SDW2]|uniref:hypothetical protein n=1 Tax=Erythrobacter sp. SDW2 TaxID=2907154 RepID=UPI001F3123D9|nr:hypothetical protein [Erythrobacter sp. SDW2]UIP07325.1 hypothetical protein LY632_02685 [Erythrobacter sp. SDW2]